MEKQMQQFFLDGIDTMMKVRKPISAMYWWPAQRSTRPGESCVDQETESTPATHFTQGVDTAPPPVDPTSPLATYGESLVAAQTEVQSLDSPAMSPVGDTTPSPSPCLLFLQIPEELQTVAQQEKDSSVGLATKPFTESIASPAPLTLWTSEERDALPPTPPGGRWLEY